MKPPPRRNSTWRPASWLRHDPYQYADPPLPTCGDQGAHGFLIVLASSVFLLFLLAGCKTHKVTTATTATHTATDSTYRSHTLVVRIDTVPVYLPTESRSATVRDTTSTLSTSVATSTASILPDGSLFHTLKNLADKPLKAPVASVSATDTIYIYRSASDTSSDTTTHIEYVAKPLSWWQTTQIYGFRILVLCLAGAVLWNKSRKRLSSK